MWAALADMTYGGQRRASLGDGSCIDLLIAELDDTVQVLECLLLGVLSLP